MRHIACYVNKCRIFYTVRKPLNLSNHKQIENENYAHIRLCGCDHSSQLSSCKRILFCFYDFFVQMFPNAHASNKLLFALFRSMYRLSTIFFFSSFIHCLTHSRSEFQFSFACLVQIFSHTPWFGVIKKKEDYFLDVFHIIPSKRIHNVVCFEQFDICVIA